MHAMLAQWVPMTERSRFAAVVYNGANFGTILSIPLTGYLCAFEGGWPYSFYIFGLAGIVWCFFWWLLVFSSPETHPTISYEEKTYIESSLERTDNELDTSNESVPWKSIFTSAPLWALLITTWWVLDSLLEVSLIRSFIHYSSGQSWVFYTQLTEIPSYLSNVLHFDIQQNAIWSSLPYATSWLFGIFCSIFADWLVERQFITQKNSFKLWNSVASIVPSLGLIGIAWAGCDRIWAMVLLTTTSSFTGANYAGTQMNHIFLAPKYAGTLYGITNGAGNLCGFLAPYFIGSMINGRENLETWSEVFHIAAFINIMGCIVFIFFAEAEEQSWNRRRSRVEWQSAIF